jgi:recombination protein RecR
MIFSSRLIEDAVTQFATLPGIGKKTALRVSASFIKTGCRKSLPNLGNTVMQMRNQIQFCATCHNVSDQAQCRICSDFSRKKNQVCVVENVRDVMAIEATQQYSGVYHVLGGLISPLDGVGPDDIHIRSLLQRLEGDQIEELIFALSPTMEGDTTSFFITKKVNQTQTKVTTLSRGLAFGGELEYTDEITLARSLQNRLPLDAVNQTG